MKPITAWILLITLCAACAAPGASTDSASPSPVPTMSAASQSPTAPPPPPTFTPPPAQVTSTPRFKIFKSVSGASGSTPTPNAFPLSEAGSHHVGKRTIVAADSSRPARGEISITLWYPALEAGGTSSLSAVMNAPPDIIGAPYALMLSSTKVANIFAAYFVSHGFTWASVDNIDTYYTTNTEMIDQPRDILFALEQVSSHPPAGLEGIIDADHAGAIGYSFDGYNALALSGARIDSEFYLDLCEDPLETEKTADFWFEGAYNCGAALQWEAFSAAAGEEVTNSQDGLWQPMTDARIRAVMPMAADGWYFFGERGLASVKIPVLFLVGTKDGLYRENALIFEHLGSAEKTFLSMLNRTHGIIFEPDILPRLRHFAIAFFGWHLQGREECEYYYSEEFVAEQKGIAYGVQPLP